MKRKNGWPTPTPFPDMFERFPLLGEEDVDDDDDENNEKEETLFTPLDYDNAFRSDRSSMKGVVIQTRVSTA
ncbi:hypothetical protein J1N35_022202 [Gossypium stocksii]|uniref:Uncharacterized protein n=1 Tax=Gossypium stocksii TaxID=47602 RepID=A0A9D3VGR1_9ROSI|nr:hypothetical protein J1N35_022202 [Gossypium stocksii]